MGSADTLPAEVASLGPAGIPQIERHRTLAALALATLVLKSLIFAPIALWPLAFICLVPWLLLVSCSARAPRVYAYSFALGMAYFLFNLRWLYPTTGPGYVALSFYLSAYFPFMAIAIRSAIRRRRLPLAVALPIVWVGGELLRAVVLSGFPWFFLSHSFYKVLTLIQVSDLVGAYGVSFLAAVVNGAVADVLIARWADAGRMPPFLRQRLNSSPVIAAALLLLVVVYGQVQLHRDTTSEGPKVAVLQGHYVNRVQMDVEDYVPDSERRKTYLSMLDAAEEQDPDLFLLPETPWGMYLNPELRAYDRMSSTSFEALQTRANRYDAYVVSGGHTKIPTPNELDVKYRLYNSAYVFRPEGGEPSRYDKVHLVPFGEFVPFRFGRLRFLYLWLNSMMPFSGPDGKQEFSAFHGDGFHVFSMQPPNHPDRVFRFGIPICYEDVMPYVSRRFVSAGEPQKRADFLLNISNDGWFTVGVQQPQHLAICTYRAVENRVGVARAVNTGISGFIEPSGRHYGLVPGPDASTVADNVGYSVQNIKVDSRYSLYSRYGDWFAWLCAGLWLALFLDYWSVRFFGRDPEEVPG